MATQFNDQEFQVGAAIVAALMKKPFFVLSPQQMKAVDIPFRIVINGTKTGGEIRRFLAEHADRFDEQRAGRSIRRARIVKLKPREERIAFFEYEINRIQSSIDYLRRELTVAGVAHDHIEPRPMKTVRCENLVTRFVAESFAVLDEELGQLENLYLNHLGDVLLRAMNQD